MGGASGILFVRPLATRWDCQTVDPSAATVSRPFARGRIPELLRGKVHGWHHYCYEPCILGACCTVQSGESRWPVSDFGVASIFVVRHRPPFHRRRPGPRPHHVYYHYYHNYPHHQHRHVHLHRARPHHPHCCRPHCHLHHVHHYHHRHHHTIHHIDCDISCPMYFQYGATRVNLSSHTTCVARSASPSSELRHRIARSA